MKIKWAVFSILVLVMAGFGKTDVKDIVKKLQKKYDKINTVYVEFKMINKFQLTGLESEVFGNLWLTRDNRFRLETEDQLLVSDTKTFWRYNKLDNQVLVDYAKKGEQDVFLSDFLFKVEDAYYSQILSEEKIEGKKVWQIKLTPKNPDDSFFQYIKVWVRDKVWDFTKIQYVDYNDNEVEYQILKLNTDAKPSGNIFQFEAAEGIEVIDLR